MFAPGQAGGHRARSLVFWSATHVPPRSEARAPVPPPEQVIWRLVHGSRYAEARVRVWRHGRELRVTVDDTLVFSRLFHPHEHAGEFEAIANGTRMNFERVGWTTDPLTSHTIAPLDHQSAERVHANGMTAAVRYFPETGFYSASAHRTDSNGVVSVADVRVELLSAAAARQVADRMAHPDCQGECGPWLSL